VGRIEGAALIMAAATDQGAGPIHLVQSEAMIYPTTVLQTDFVKFTYAIQVNGLSLLYLMQKALPRARTRQQHCRHIDRWRRAVCLTGENL